MALLSHLGHLYNNLPTSISPVPLHSLKPYKVPWSSLAVHVVHATIPNSHVLYALNASVVALCKVPDLIIQVSPVHCI